MRQIVTSGQQQLIRSGRQTLLIASMANENRDGRMREYLCGNAPEQHRCDPASSVRGHHDEVAAFLLCGGYYRLVRVIMDDLRGLALHTGDLRLISHSIQNRSGVLPRVLGVLVEGGGHQVPSGSRDIIDVE